MCYLLPFLLLAVQPAQDDITQSFSESFEVRLITIEVVVTDPKGQPVANLKRDDFQVLVDGSEVTTRYFEEIRRSSINESGEKNPGTETGNYFLVFIDDYFTEHLFRKPMIKRLLADLDAMEPADRMAVVRYRGRELEPLIGWTDDREALRTIIKGVVKMPTGQMQRELSLEMSRRSSGFTRSEQIEKVTSAIAVAMRGFYLPGERQNLVLVSSGWPIRPVFNQEADFFAVSNYRGVGMLRPITDTANLLGYTIYPLQLQLPRSAPAASASRPSAFPRSTYDSRLWVSLESLSFLADETGGLATSRALIHKAPLEQAIADTHSYYVLGFSRFNHGAGRQGIKVVVNRPGLVARYRKNFRFLTRGEEAAMKTEGALLIGGSGHRLQMTFGEPSKKGWGKIMMPIRLYIPMDWVTVTAQEGSYRTNLELLTMAEDKNGNRSEMGRLRITFSGPKPKPGEIATFDSSVLIRKKAQRLVFSLRDIPSGELRVAAVRMDPKNLVIK